MKADLIILVFSFIIPKKHYIWSHKNSANKKKSCEWENFFMWNDYNVYMKTDFIETVKSKVGKIL